MGKIAFLFECGYIIFTGWGKPPLPLDIFASDIPYIQKIYIALLSYAIVYIYTIALKGNMLKRKQWVNIKRVSSRLYLSHI